MKLRDSAAVRSAIPIDQPHNKTLRSGREFRNEINPGEAVSGRGWSIITLFYDFSCLSASDVVGGRRSTILSMIPKLRASLAVIKWSRSSARSGQSKE
jgi:hypothetical protein